MSSERRQQVIIALGRVYEIATKLRTEHGAERMADLPPEAQREFIARANVIFRETGLRPIT